MKKIKLNDPVSSNMTNVVAFVEAGAMLLMQPWKLNTTTRVNTLDDNNGDCVISAGAIVADGDKLFSASWGRGFAQHSISNAGVLSSVFSELKPDGSQYYYHNLGINKARKLIFIGRYSYDRLVKYDYSSGTCVNNGLVTPSTTNIPSAKAGYAYTNGLEFAGDWLYIGRYGTSSNVARWNPVTDVGETLTVTSKVADGKNGMPIYDAVNDRMYMTFYSGGGLWVIDDASTSTPTAWGINLTTYGLNNSQISGGVHVLSNGNIVVLSNRVAAILHVENGNTYRVGDLSNSAYLNKTIELRGQSRISPNGNLPVIYPDRGYCNSIGFYDKDNGVLVSGMTGAGIIRGSVTPTRFDYGGSVAQVSSPDGSLWNVTAGYSGANGHKFNVWSGNDNYEFSGTSWEIIFGPYTISEDYKVIRLEIEDLQIMSGASFNAYYSTDGGTTYYSISLSTDTTIATPGNSLKIKLSGTNTNTSGVYIYGSPPVVMLQDTYTDIQSVSTTTLIGG